MGLKSNRQVSKCLTSSRTENAAAYFPTSGNMALEFQVLIFDSENEVNAELDANARLRSA